ncbi:MAG: hypothetical protein L0I24_09880 [Pseudonocardia sp.]|nr:hypothetical protein [Pseudonocardia sp.]MDN5931354.1 hypothetical protein [Pseudonocardia sp.]
MLDTLLILTALLALALAGGAAIRARHLSSVLGDQGLQLGAIRERIHMSDDDVDRYHDRIHPACAETGGR